YNSQQRSTATYQVVESVSGTKNLRGGLHLYKAGFDLLYSRYQGNSASRPVLVERTDGTLARRLDFTGPSAQSVDSTDLALFVQDRFQPNARWFLEFGGRIDRDGIVDRMNLTPRVGTAILLDDTGKSVLRGGFGLFYERTPSTVAAFPPFQSALDTRFSADGRAVIGVPIRFVHATTPDLETPRSRTWDVGFDHRINERWSIRAAMIDRTGNHELIVDPVRNGDAGSLVLSSSGRSRYREEEVGVQVTHGPAAELKPADVPSTAPRAFDT